MSAPRLPRYGSSLSRQIQKERDHDLSEQEANRSPSKPRSLSDTPAPTLSPSPAIIETNTATQDDISVTGPTTPRRRPNFPLRGLSLQMPQKDLRGPLSPKLDQTQTFGTPVLPRRSRGLDFSRACTNLHHSTLAEPSPDSSPTITGARSMHIPKKSLGATSDLGNGGSNGLWSTGVTGDRAALSSSISSVNMLDSDAESSDSSDDDLMDRDMEDSVLTTPQVMKLGNNFGAGVTNSPGGEWMNNQYSPAAASLLSFQRARLGKHRSRHSSSSGHSSKPSPAPLSPPVLKSIETQGYFTQRLTKKEVQSRRESLSLGTNDLHLDDSGDEDLGRMNTPSVTENGSRGVIRRAVTRRGSLLPKTKTFARIRAELIDEAAPIDSEAKREAQVIHQVRESEPVAPRPSPRLAAIPGAIETLESVLEDEAAMQDDPMVELTLKKTNSFSHHAEKNSGGLKFWNTFDERYRTPPPQLLPTRSSSGMSMSDEVSTYGLPQAEGINANHSTENRSQSSTPVAYTGPPTAAEVSRKVNNKRRRDDDFDPESFKRRAVSPGLSVQSSPIMSQSPVFTDLGKTWGRPPSKSKDHNERSNSGGSSGGGLKRVGLQGMTETNDGIMNMSIE